MTRSPFTSAAFPEPLPSPARLSPLFLLLILIGLLCSCTTAGKLGTEPAELSLEHAEFSLPPAIEAQRNRASSWVRLFQASDGTVFLCDDLEMALWIKKEAGWHRLLNKVRIEKTFGGSFPQLPVTYAGNGFFAVARTVPGEVPASSPEGFPQALAETFLLDSSNGKVVQRTRPFVYDHNPPVRVPASWTARYQLTAGVVP